MKGSGNLPDEGSGNLLERLGHALLDRLGGVGRDLRVDARAGSLVGRAALPSAAVLVGRRGYEQTVASLQLKLSLLAPSALANAR